MRDDVQRGRSIHFRYLALAGIVALVQFRILMLVLGPRFRLCVEAAQGVLDGEPHWRVYQNRLLGPWLVEGLGAIVGSFERAHVFAAILILTVSGYLVLSFLSRIHAGTDRILAGYFVFAFLVVCCFNRHWLYVWDLLDLLLFVAFNAFVVLRLDYRYFVGLFAVAIFNRESAYFIAAWMIVDPLIRLALDRSGEPRRERLDVRMLVAGTLLLVGGVALVETLRTALLVREVGPQLVGPVAGAGPLIHFMLPANLEQMGTALTSFRFTMSFLVPLALVLFLVFCAAVARRDPARTAGVALIHALMIAALLVFGILFETRIYLVLVPFVVFHLWPPGLAPAGGATSRC